MKLIINNNNYKKIKNKCKNNLHHINKINKNKLIKIYNKTISKRII